MPLAEFLITTAGPAIAKTVLKLWASDGKWIEESGDAAVDILGKLVPDLRARNEADRQLAAIGERAAESLKFIFDTEGKTIFVDDQEAVAMLVASTLDRSKISTGLLAEKNLDPVRLASHFLAEAQNELADLPLPRAELFRRVIGEASQSIVDIAHSLPNFSERTFAELLRRSQILTVAVDRVFEELQRLRSQTDVDLQIESSRFETDYRRAVARNLDKMELFGVDLERTSKSHPLSVAYVSLEVGRPGPLSETEKQSPRKSALDDESDESTEESVIQNVETALAEHQRILIKGPAGAGKTTLLRWIAVRAASRGFEEPLDAWNDALPFVIRLREFSGRPLPRPEEFPALAAPTVSGEMPSKDWVHQKLNSGTAVVMVDGVDEVAESRRDEVRQWVTELTETFPLLKLIVTSRPYAVDEGWLEADGFGEADLQPMGISSIEKFIEQWHQAVAELVSQEAEATVLTELSGNLKQTLRSNRAIRRLATNPLLCGVICALHRDTNQQLPKDRIDLYERCCSMLLERRDPESGLKLTDYPQLTYRQKRALLDDLAYWMIKNEWTQVSIDPAKDHIGKKLKNFQESATHERQATPSNVLGFFLERSGMLRQPVEGKLDFAHRTFQEYMAAQAAVDEGDIGVLVSHATNPQWREVIVLGAGLARPRERRDLITELIKKGDETASNKYQLHLLAAACLDTSVEIDSNVKKSVEERVRRLIPPSRMPEAALLADAAGEIAVPFLKRSPDGPYDLYASQAAACVRALGLIGSLEALQAVADYATDSRVSVLKEVVRAAERFETDLYSRWVGERLDATKLSGELLGKLIDRGVDGIKRLSSATALKLSDATPTALLALKECPELRTLTVGGAANTDISPLAALSRLEWLSVSGPIKDISPLQMLTNLAHLKSLDLSYTGVHDITAVGSLIRLESLDLSHTPVRDITALKTLVNLKSLRLVYTQVKNILSLNTLVNLESLILIGSPVNDLSPLEKSTLLRRLDIDGTDVVDLSPLAFLTDLGSLDVQRTKVSKDQVQTLQRIHPSLRIVGLGS